MTAIVDAVAFETQKNQFRGSVLGQQGLFINKAEMKAAAAGFDLADFAGNANAVHEYAKTNTTFKF